MMKQFNLLGIKFSPLTVTDFDAVAASLLQEDYCHQLVTINPEFLVQAYFDPRYKALLNQADLATVDGFGLILMAWLTGQYRSNLSRLTGVELTHKLLALAEKKQLKVTIILPDQPLASREEITRTVSQLYPSLRLEIFYERELLQRPSISADIVLVTFGSPRQDTWIDQERKGQLRAVKLAAGVGGTFDFISGKIRRAPLWLRSLGLEWLWRLYKEPRRRFKRIVRAVIVFPWLVLIGKR